MKSEENYMTDEILVKYLLAEASEAERNQVLNWINDNNTNRKHFEQLRLIWAESGKLAYSSNVSTEDAWARFKQGRQQKNNARQIPLSSRPFSWVRVAAILVLLVGGALLAYYYIGSNKTPQQVVSHITIPPAEKDKDHQNIAPVNEPAAPPAEKEKDIKEIPEEKPLVHVQKHDNNLKIRTHDKVTALQKNTKQMNVNSSDEIVCNGTPCPIEICIIQTVKCGKKKPAQISTCSTIEPDQSGQLRYKAMDNIDKDCALNVQEIRIKRLSTGETIVLNAHSSPVTAQDLFGYITGQKKGDVMAGIFHTDCNNYDHEHGLNFDNHYGDLIVH